MVQAKLSCHTQRLARVPPSFVACLVYRIQKTDRAYDARFVYAYVRRAGVRC